LDSSRGGASTHLLKIVFLSKKQNSQKTKSKNHLEIRYFLEKSCKTAAALGASPLIGAKVGGGGQLPPGIFFV